MEKGNKNSIDVYRQLEMMRLEEFKNILKGNVEIPLLEERYKIVRNSYSILIKRENNLN